MSAPIQRDLSISHRLGGEKGVRMRGTYAIVFVSDMKRSVSFYRDVLGLPLKF
jgi:hypothetical protein